MPKKPSEHQQLKFCENYYLLSYGKPRQTKIKVALLRCFWNVSTEECYKYFIGRIEIPTAPWKAAVMNLKYSIQPLKYQMEILVPLLLEIKMQVYTVEPLMMPP